MGKDRLKDILGRWRIGLNPDPQTVEHVLTRIASGEQDSGRRFIQNRAVPFLTAFGAAAILLFGIIIIVGQQAQNRILQDQQYLTLIDPVARARLHVENASRDRLLEQLSWMQHRFELSREQFIDLVDLHQNYSTQFDALYEDLLRLENEYDQFELQRKNDRMVDFMALYDLLTDQKETQSHAHQLSRELVMKVSGILTPSQRSAYLSLVSEELDPNA